MSVLDGNVLIRILITDVVLVRPAENVFFTRRDKLGKKKKK